MQRTIIALDVGRSAVKSRAYVDGRVVQVMFPSVVARWIKIGDTAAAQTAELETVTVDGMKYFTGEVARIQSGTATSVGLKHDWVQDIEYKALVLSAMKRLAAAGVPVQDEPIVIVGTPAALYRDQRDALERITRQCIAGDVRVLSQPMGAYFAWVLGENGMPLMGRMKDENGHRSSWAVVEIGHFTTDFLLMREGQYIEMKSQSCDGLHLAVNHLGDLLSTKQMHLTKLDLEQALTTKHVKHYGKKSVAEEVDAAATFAAEEILRFGTALLSADLPALDGLLLAGGGASLLAPKLKRVWQIGTVLPEPRMAVAEGFLRFARGMELQRIAQTSMSDAATS